MSFIFLDHFRPHVFLHLPFCNVLCCQCYILIKNVIQSDLGYSYECTFMAMFQSLLTLHSHVTDVQTFENIILFPCCFSPQNY